jgi:hypothetical protein
MSSTTVECQQFWSIHKPSNPVFRFIVLANLKACKFDYQNSVILVVGKFKFNTFWLKGGPQDVSAFLENFGFSGVEGTSRRRLFFWALALTACQERLNPTCLVQTFYSEILKAICSSEANLKPFIPTCPSWNSCSCILCSVYRLQTRNSQKITFPLYGNIEFRKRVFIFKFLCRGVQKLNTVHEQNGDECLLRSQ